MGRPPPPRELGSVQHDPAHHRPPACAARTPSRTERSPELTWCSRDLPNAEEGQLQVGAGSWRLRAVRAMEARLPPTFPLASRIGARQTRSRSDSAPFGDRRRGARPGVRRRQSLRAGDAGIPSTLQVEPVRRCRRSEGSGGLRAPAGCRGTQRHSWFQEGQDETRTTVAGGLVLGQASPLRSPHRGRESAAPRREEAGVPRGCFRPLLQHPPQVPARPQRCGRRREEGGLCIAPLRRAESGSPD